VRHDASGYYQNTTRHTDQFQGSHLHPLQGNCRLCISHGTRRRNQILLPRNRTSLSECGAHDWNPIWCLRVYEKCHVESRFTQNATTHKTKHSNNNDKGEATAIITQNYVSITTKGRRNGRISTTSVGDCRHGNGGKPRTTIPRSTFPEKVGKYQSKRYLKEKVSQSSFHTHKLLLNMLNASFSCLNHCIRARREEVTAVVSRCA
jgi:hypothetical protein